MKNKTKIKWDDTEKVSVTYETNDNLNEVSDPLSSFAAALADPGTNSIAKIRQAAQKFLDETGAVE